MAPPFRSPRGARWCVPRLAVVNAVLEPLGPSVCVDVDLQFSWGHRPGEATVSQAIPLFRVPRDGPTASQSGRATRPPCCSRSGSGSSTRLPTFIAGHFYHRLSSGIKQCLPVSLIFMSPRWAGGGLWLEAVGGGLGFVPGEQVSTVAKDADRPLSMCLPATFISSSEKCLLRPCGHL